MTGKATKVTGLAKTSPAETPDLSNPQKAFQQYFNTEVNIKNNPNPLTYAKWREKNT